MGVIDDADQADAPGGKSAKKQRDCAVLAGKAPQMMPLISNYGVRPEGFEASLEPANQ
jgi:hypothetical protein